MILSQHDAVMKRVETGFFDNILADLQLEGFILEVDFLRLANSFGYEGVLKNTPRPRSNYTQKGGTEVTGLG